MAESRNDGVREWGSGTSPTDVVLEIVQCPRCIGSLEPEGGSLLCTGCGLSFRCIGSAPCFLDEPMLPVDFLDGLKARLKQFPRAYNFALDFLSPVHPMLRRERREVRREIELSQNLVVVNAGSGTSVIDSRIVNIDSVAYPSVHLIATLEDLPIKSNSVDIVVCYAVLEHVLDPEASVAEFFRILRPGGQLRVFVPFIQGYHASPHDYQRFTISGLRHLVRDFDVRQVSNAGPTSSLIWILGEWLSLILTFGNRKAQAALAGAFWVLLSPLKYLDGVLRHLPPSENIATGFLFICTKPK